MQPDKFLMFRNRLAKVYKHLSKIAKRQNISCYRVYDHDLPEFPFCIEIYENKLYVAEYKRNHQMDDDIHFSWMNECKLIMSNVLNINIDEIYIKTRKKKTDRQDQYQKTAVTKNEFMVKENELQFMVNLSDYLDTGLFLDHRITRKLVQEQSAGKRVLNLFAYTGSFSVYAAAGGAAKVTTVDLSNTYINWSKINFDINQFKNIDYEFIVADVIKYLDTIVDDSFDIIVLDPPTFSNSKKMDGILDIQKDYINLVNNCIRILSVKGILYFSNNYTKFQLDENAINSNKITDITRATTPFDFEGKLKRWCYKIEKD